MIATSFKLTRLTRWQKVAAAVYGGGDYAYMATEENPNYDIENTGDGLFSFIMRELADDGGELEPEEAIRRMERAIEDVQVVLSALHEAAPIAIEIPVRT